MRLPGPRIRHLRVPKDLVVAKSAPAHRRMLRSLGIGDGGPLPRCSTVGAAETPCHFEDPGSIDDRLHPESGRPRRGIVVGDEYITCVVELPGRPAKEFLIRLGKSPIITLEMIGALEPHASRSSRKSSTLSNPATRPAAMASSASCSIFCHRFSQNHA